MSDAAPVLDVWGGRGRDPIPLGVRIGKIIYASSIAGMDLGTGQLAEGLDGQFDLAFQNMRTLVEQAGAFIDNIGHVTFVLKHLRDRSGINRPWLAMFPDEGERPTYKFMEADLPGDRLVQLQALAVAGSRRQLLNIPGIAHGNPIPLGVKIGNLLFTSRILPMDPATGKNGEGPEEQAKLAFQNMETLLHMAGARPSDVSQVWVFLKDAAYLHAVDGPWDELFRDAGPARHPIRVDLPGTLLVMVECTAVLP